MRTEDERAYTWQGQLAVGAAGEEVVADWLRASGRTVMDCRSSVSYRRDDIDFLVLPVGGNAPDDWFGAEVKTDTYDNDYVFFETHSKEHNPGALFKSRARVWYIYKPKRGQIIAVEPARVITHLWLESRTKSGLYYQLFPVFNQDKRIRAWGVKLSVATLTELGGVVHYLDTRRQSDEDDSADPSGIDRGTR